MSRSARALLWLALLLPPSTRALPPGYHLTWGDEFSGTNINSAKWSYGALPWGGQHHNDSYSSYITPEDSYLNGTGSLICRCRQGSFGGYPWSEGFVHSNGKFRFTYGYVEVRARFPVFKGTWPAFWTLSDGWPPEFDIAEYFGDDNRMHNGFAYGTCCPVNWDSSNFYDNDFGSWHTYGLEWGPGFAKWYRDGNLRKTITASYVTTLSEYIILNSGMTYGFAGTTANPNYTEFDYCRVYLAGASTPPTLTDISNRTTPTNTPTPPLPFTVGDAETPLGELTITTASANTTVVPAANVVLSGTGANRTVTVTPAPGQSGSSLISINVFDGEFTTTKTFTITASGTNSSPVISALADIALQMNALTGGRAFTVGDNETPASALTLSATSSNPDLIPLANISFSGGGSNRLIVLKPVRGLTGSSVIDVTVSDGALTAHDSFRVTVSDPNNLVMNPGFENGLAPWTNVFGGTVGSTATTVHDGLVAGTLTARTQWYYGLGAPLLGKLTNGATYRCSAWVRLSGTTNDTAYLSMRVTDASGTHYYRAVDGHASSNAWTRLSGDVTPVFVGAVTETVLYVEGAAAGVTLIADDFSVVPADPNVLVPLGSVWRYRDNGTLPAANWMATNYNDSGWSNGPAQLGYGDGDEMTTVGYGGVATNKYITTWFRRVFNVADPAQWTALDLRLLRDDGVVVYLNGTEILRNNLPAGAVTPSTLATIAAVDDGNSFIFSTNLSPALLVAGSNVLAVEIHQAAANSSDITFDLELRGVPPAPDTLIAANGDWKYNDTGANLGTAWHAPVYNDSAWPVGFAQLGYGDGDENTVVSYGPSATTKYITTYFRRAFTLPNPAAYNQYLVRLQRDDGAIVYLNDAEIFRSNMSNGPVNYLTLAIAATAADDGNTWWNTNVPPAFFVVGTNVVAVEVHQALATSSDLSFDLELTGYAATVLPAIQWSHAGGNWSLQWPSWATGYTLYTCTNMATANWLPMTNGITVAGGFNKVSLSGSNQLQFFRLKQ